MKNLIINIGLNIGTVEPEDQLQRTLDLLKELFTIDVFKVDEGQWINEEGETITEGVIVVSVNVGGLKESAINLLMISLAIQLYQDAIAYKLNGEGNLVYNPAYVGNKFSFDQEFFKEF